MSGRKQETKPPKLDIKKSRCVLFPTKSNAKPLNSGIVYSIFFISINFICFNNN